MVEFGEVGLYFERRNAREPPRAYYMAWLDRT
jgi:hypothetical protein